MTTDTGGTVNTTDITEDRLRIERAILDHDAGDAPGSPYGTGARDWAPVAALACVIYAGEAGESAFTEDGAVDLDWCDGIIGAVVNGHDGPGETIAAYGEMYGVDPADFLDNPADYAGEGATDNA